MDSSWMANYNELKNRKKWGIQTTGTFYRNHTFTIKACICSHYFVKISDHLLSLLLKELRLRSVWQALQFRRKIQSNFHVRWPLVIDHLSKFPKISTPRPYRQNFVSRTANICCLTVHVEYDIAAMLWSDRTISWKQRSSKFPLYKQFIFSLQGLKALTDWWT